MLLKVIQSYSNFIQSYSKLFKVNETIITNIATNSDFLTSYIFEPMSETLDISNYEFCQNN